MVNQTYSTAFVEFADIAYAIAFINATQIQPGTIGGQEFYTSYSAHKSLEPRVSFPFLSSLPLLLFSRFIPPSLPSSLHFEYPLLLKILPFPVHRHFPHRCCALSGIQCLTISHLLLTLFRHNHKIRPRPSSCSS